MHEEGGSQRGGRRSCGQVSLIHRAGLSTDNPGPPGAGELERHPPQKSNSRDSLFPKPIPRPN